jgi:hypothetical protein
MRCGIFGREITYEKLITLASLLLIVGNGPIDTALRSGFDCSGRLS